MMRFLTICFLCLLFPLAASTRNLQPRNLNFEHLNTGNGLSFNTITSIAQDSAGIMWFGSRYGLNSYDGTHIKKYYTQHGDQNSLPENQIKNVIAEGMTLYIQTFGAISIYDIVHERFTNISLPGIRAMAVDGEQIWAGTINALYRLSKTDGSLTRERIAIPDGESVSALLLAARNVVFGTNKAVYCYDRVQSVSKLLDGVTVVSLYRDSRKRLWVATMKQGVYCLAPDGKTENFRAPTISHDFVRCVMEDPSGEIWLGTLEGLDHFDPESRRSQTYKYDAADPTSLSHSSVWSIFCNRDGAMWIGTYFGGINILHPSTNHFRYYPVSRLGNRGLNYHIVGAMCQTSNGDLYIGTEGGGLNRYDPKTEQFSYYEADPSRPYSISCNNVKQLSNYRDSVLLVATHTGGLNLFNLKTRRFRSLSHDPSHREYIPSNSINDIDAFGDKYLLSTQDGMMLFDLHSGQVAPFLPLEYRHDMPDRIMCTTVDHLGRVWIGSEFYGVALYDPANGSFRQYEYDSNNPYSLSSNLIHQIFEDRFFRIWISTPAGLNLYDPTKERFIHFNDSDGMPSDIALAVADSQYDDIILTTTDGISFFNLAEHRFTNFTKENGLPLNTLNNNSLLCTPDGTIYIGGFNGMVSLNERQVRTKKHHNNIRITSLQVRQREIQASDSTGILKRNILFTDRIRLSHNDNTFAILFSDLGLTRGQRAKLIYQLEGYDPEPIQADGSNRTAYTNVPPGKYRFVVHYSDPDTDAQQATLDIVIAPPFYFAWWAILIYLLIVAFVAFMLNRSYLLRRRAEQQLLIQQLEAARENEYNQERLRFFTNVSHEFRTPLTLISGGLEQILGHEDLNVPERRQILGVFKHVKRLRSLVDELLDLHKQENGFSTITPRTDDINGLLREVFVSFTDLAAQRHLSYTLQAASEPVWVDFDRRAMERVFYNLLSNAFKFTEKGDIAVSISAGGGNDGSVVIRVQDSGIGIAPKDQTRIFERFYQVQGAPRQNTGTGIGLATVKQTVEAHGGTISVHSEMGQGSLFEIRLPLSNQKPDSGSMPNSVQDSILDDKCQIEDILASLKQKYTGHRQTILVVEDNPDMQRFLEEILSPFYKVEKASDGLQGYLRAKELQPALILSDVMMPNMSGTEMCARLKGDFQTSHLPVVLLTARTATEHTVEGLSVGADDYISKPFSIRLLLARIENVLNNRRILQERFSGEPSTGTETLPAPGEDGAFIDRAYRIIEKHIDNSDYSVDEFASDMHLGRTVFFQKLKGVTGMTPNEFILTIRLKHAVKLMNTQPGISIAEVSDRSGFNSPQYFSSCFKRKFKISPGQYLKKGHDTKNSEQNLK